MMVTVKIAQAHNSPTQKVWGAVIPHIKEDIKDAAIFYGPSTKLGGSVYAKPRVTAVDMYYKKIGGEYAEIYSAQFDTDINLKDAAHRILRGIQGGNLSVAIELLKSKSVDPIPEPVPVQPEKPRHDIAASIRQIPCGCDWSF